MNVLKAFRDYVRKPNRAIDSAHGTRGNRPTVDAAAAKASFFHGDTALLARLSNSDYLLNACVASGIEFLSYSSADDRLYFRTKDGVRLATDFFYWMLLDVFAHRNHALPPTICDSQYVAFDIGMNRGYASLWFAKDRNCKHVYGFEIDDDTYKFALDNFQLNPAIAAKISPFCFGLFDDDSVVDLVYVPGQDSCSTLEDTRFFDSYYSDDRKQAAKRKKAEVRRASAVIDGIIMDDNIASKIDVEGAEYRILDDLSKSGVLNKCDVILGECHQGMKDIEQKCSSFRLVSLKPQHVEELKLFCFVKK